MDPRWHSCSFTCGDKGWTQGCIRVHLLVETRGGPKVAFLFIYLWRQGVDPRWHSCSFTCGDKGWTQGGILVHLLVETRGGPKVAFVFIYLWRQGVEEDPLETEIKGDVLGRKIYCTLRRHHWQNTLSTPPKVEPIA